MLDQLPLYLRQTRFRGCRNRVGSFLAREQTAWNSQTHQDRVQIGVMFILLGDNAQPHRIGPEMDEVLIKLPRGQFAKFLFQLLMLRLRTFLNVNFHSMNQPITEA